jgi:hypothetical protein
MHKIQLILKLNCCTEVNLKGPLLTDSGGKDGASSEILYCVSNHEITINEVMCQAIETLSAITKAIAACLALPLNQRQVVNSISRY